MADTITPTPKAGRKRGSKVDPNETPRERFVRIAQLRTANVLTSLDRMTALANQTSYEYTDADIEKIEKAIREKTEGVITALYAGKPTAERFSL